MHDMDLQMASENSPDSLPIFSLQDCEHLIKNEFQSDEDDLLSDITLEFSPEYNLNDVLESPKKCNESRKSRRKALLPQRAVQSNLSQTGSFESNSPESSQDVPSLVNSFNSDILGHNVVSVVQEFTMSDNELPESEDLLRDIDEENIFKGIREETDGEKVDDEILDNVKEEWRAHWGVKCNMCEKVFPYKTEFDNHYMENYRATPVYTCSFCNKTAEKYSTFRSHCYRHITEGRYKCKECGKGFSLQSMLQVHTVAKHSKAKPFRCEECGKSFVTKPGLKIHVKKHKSETKEDYPCVQCGKVLHTRGGLTSHINVHRLGRRFMCDICGKTFTQKVNMQQHAKQHTGDKPYACDQCDKTFAEKSHLARHYSFHSNHRPFKCEVCSKMYKTERCLKVHSMVHAPARPFVCMYCNKGFLSSTKLKQHYNVHTGEKPYACRYCERKFTNYPNWLKHTRRRHRVDHKTGEQLDPKPLKEESPKAQLVQNHVEQVPLQTADVSVESLNMDMNQFKVESLFLQQQQVKSEDLFMQQQQPLKTEDLFLQQPNLLNFPLTDNDGKLLLNEDLLNSGTNSNTSGFLVPYFQNQLPQQNIIQSNIPQSHFQAQFGEFMPSLFQNTLPCE